jgi:hypothetical protein
MKVTIDSEEFNIDVEKAQKLGVITPVKPKIHRKFGDKFRHKCPFDGDLETYMLVFSHDDPKEVGLVCLDDGLWWYKYVKVGDRNDITEEEWDKITDFKSEEFTKI